MPLSGFQIPDEIERKPVTGLKLFQNIRQTHLLLHPFTVRLRHHGVHVFRFRLCIARMAQGIPDCLLMHLIHVRMIKRHLLRDHVLDQVHGIIRRGQRGNNRISCGRVRFSLDLLFRYIGDEHHVDSAIGIGFRIMAVVIYPPDASIPADNPVLGIIHLIIAGIDLMDDGNRNPLIILRMDHSPERVTRQVLKFFQSAAPVDVKNRLIRIDQLFRFFRPVDKEAAGHMTADFLDD